MSNIIKPSIKSNIHIKSIKSKNNILKRKEISLSFSYANLLTKYTYFHYLARLPSSSSKINDYDIKKTFKVLKSLKNTKIIKLDFRNSKNLTDKGLLWISKYLRKLSSINSLLIDLTGCYQITEEGINNLTKRIKRLKYLKKIQLESSRMSSSR